MPTTPASAGTSVGKNGKLASLPRTKNTVSPTPAPTASTATSVRPTAVPSAAIGCSTSNVRLARFSSLRVTTTLPMTLASCTGSVSCRDFDGVDDADDGGVDRAILQSRGQPSRAAADDQHGFADAGVDGVDGDEVTAFRLAVRVHRARHHQLVADEARIFPGGDNGPDYAGEDHGELRLGAGVGLADRQCVLEVGVGPRDDVHGHELADAAGRSEEHTSEL